MGKATEGPADHRQERDLGRLRKTYEAEVAALAEVARAEGAEGPAWDEVALSRWAKSFRDSPEGSAAAAVRFTAQWRREKPYLVAAAEAEPGPTDEQMGRVVGGMENLAKMRRYMIVDYWDVELKDGDILFVIRGGVSNLKALCDEIPRETILDYMLYFRLRGFMMCDRRTRERGRLCKLVVVNDLKYASLSGFESRFKSVLQETSRLSEKLFPQLLDKAVMLNIPGWVLTVMKALLVLMPQKAAAKTAVCPGQSLREPTSKCQYGEWSRKKFDNKDLPRFLGGGRPCPGGVFAGAPEEITEMQGRQGTDGAVALTVPARDFKDVLLPVPEGCSTLAYRIVLEDKGIEFQVLQEQPDEDEPEVIKEQHKFKASEGPQEGAVKLKGRGTIVVRFDNSYSVLNSKKLKYSFTVA